mmetsp:Transcript_21954/g.42632  ORF Transcript_21954/g.42632 Transcript_21954/m.42632 type:complete len:646 (-) Transcript_21954:234-2171(-)
MNGRRLASIHPPRSLRSTRYYTTKSIELKCFLPHGSVENRVYPVRQHLSFLSVSCPSTQAQISTNKRTRTKWNSLEHNGILFPPPYEAHGVRILYEGEPVNLTPEAEEMATKYAEILFSEMNGATTSYSKDDTFTTNMFMDWSKRLGASHPIKSLQGCDFGPIVAYLADRKRKREAMTKEEKKMERLRRNQEREKLIDTYGHVLIDGSVQRVSQFQAEIPGWFRGRGSHKMSGKWKPRLWPEDVVLNLSEESAIPECPLPGRQWGGVVHNREATYIARWKDCISNGYKHVSLATSSKFKAESDLTKFETARKLRRKIDTVRKRYTTMLSDKDERNRQLATALWLIDNLALRVGGEKDIEISADTVGVCTLRAEHVRDFSVSVDQEHSATLDFLGKDSMRYVRKVELPSLVWHNLQLFARKALGSRLFDLISPESVNSYLRRQMPGLSAKVFRTCNASSTMQRELVRPSFPGSETMKIEPSTDMKTKRLYLDFCNREVALLCNHLKTIPKNASLHIDNLRKRIQKQEEWLGMLNLELEESKNKETVPREERKTKTGKPATRKARAIETIQTDILKQNNAVATLKRQLAFRQTSGDIALTTSKTNYIDPRITIAWCKRMDFPIEKSFSKALLTRFEWALNTKRNFKW